MVRPGTTPQAVSGVSLPAHTPGEWAVVQPADDYDSISVCAFDGDPRDGIMLDVIAEITSVCDEADACLIAAAPDLLEALQDAVADELGDNWRSRARAAIAKATGQ